MQNLLILPKEKLQNCKIKSSSLFIKSGVDLGLGRDGGTKGGAVSVSPCMNTASCASQESELLTRGEGVQLACLIAGVFLGKHH